MVQRPRQQVGIKPAAPARVDIPLRRLGENVAEGLDPVVDHVERNRIRKILVEDFLVKSLQPVFVGAVQKLLKAHNLPLHPRTLAGPRRHDPGKAENNEPGKRSRHHAFPRRQGRKHRKTEDPKYQHCPPKSKIRVAHPQRTGGKEPALRHLFEYQLGQSRQLAVERFFQRGNINRFSFAGEKVVHQPTFKDAELVVGFFEFAEIVIGSTLKKSQRFLGQLFQLEVPFDGKIYQAGGNIAPVEFLIYQHPDLSGSQRLAVRFGRFVAHDNRSVHFRVAPAAIPQHKHQEKHAHRHGKDPILRQVGFPPQSLHTARRADNAFVPPHRDSKPLANL